MLGRFLRQLAVCGLALGACREQPVESGIPVWLEITAEDTATLAGRTLGFGAKAYDRLGREVSAGRVRWTVSDTTRGGINPQGMFAAGPAGGDLWVRVSLAQPRLSDSVWVHVALPGEVRWRYTPVAGRVFDGIGGVALGLDGTVYVLEDVENQARPTRSALVALNADGSTRWSVELPSILYNYPVVTSSGSVLVAGQIIYLVSPGGAVQWQQQTTYPLPIFASGAATDNTIVVAVGFDAQAYNLNPPVLMWSAPPESLAAWIVPPSIDAAGRVYIKHSRDTLFVFRLADGTLLRTFLDPDTLPDDRVFGAGAVPVGARVYMPTASRLAAFDSTGQLLWLTSPPRGLGMTEPVIAPGGDLYVQHATNGLWALRPDGTERWKFPNAWPRWSWYGGPALARNGIIYAAGRDGFYAVSSTGQQLWSFQADSAGTPQAFVGAPAIAPDGTVYSFTSTHLYAFWGAEPPEPNSPWPMWRHDAQRTGWAR